MASKFVYALDPGHGGMIGGKYQTAGKRSPKFDDGTVLYEGVNNRDIVRRLIIALEAEDIKCIDIVASENDVSLETRVERANKLAKTKPCVYLSFHSDANGNGVEWDQASGMSAYTSKGQTKSDEFAQLAIDELQENFGTEVKWRTDNTDKDEDKEENFYVLKNTTCPSVLFELGFHTNKEEAAKMLTADWKNKIVLSIVYAIKKFELKN
jgi:N-acetylmuramoyl-L-alanine amidase